jgi:hypothetical protein
MSDDIRPTAAWSRWTRDGRTITVYEDRPGVVEVSTDALGELLRSAGFTEQREPIQGVAVQGTSQVLRDEHGRCQDCGTPPQEPHRSDCPHHDAFRNLRASSAGRAPHEQRPGSFGAETR